MLCWWGCETLIWSNDLETNVTSVIHVASPSSEQILSDKGLKLEVSVSESPKTDFVSTFANSYNLECSLAVCQFLHTLKGATLLI